MSAFLGSNADKIKGFARFLTLQNSRIFSLSLPLFRIREK